MAQVTEFKLGDIVRLTKGEPDKPGYECRVREVTSGDLSPGRITSSMLRAFENAGWTVELVERPLPTKPNTLGWATVGDSRHLARLACGQWELYSSDGSLGAIPHPSTIEDFEEAVLIPKELADEITAWNRRENAKGALALLAEIADHLKGQDNE